MSKFNLFARSALRSATALAAVAGVGAGSEDPATPLDPDEDEDETTGEVEAGKPKKMEASAEASAEAGVDVVTLADANAHGVAQFAAGIAAERARTATVMGSDAGRGNAEMASFMLSNTDAAADVIITQLGTLPSPVLQLAAISSIAGQIIPDTGVDLGSAGAAAALSGTGDTSNIWAEVQGTAKPSASDRGPFTARAASVTTGGAILSSPAVRQTGN